MSNENVADGDVRRKGGLGQRIAYACGNLGQAAFYNAMSTYFVTYVTSCLFVSYSKALAAQMIAVITGLIVVIRIAEIFMIRCWATSWITPPPSGAVSARGSSSADWSPPC